MRSISLSDTMEEQYGSLSLPEPYGGFLGDIWPGFQILLWGEKGSGKSTQALLLAAALVPHAEPFGGKVLYLSGEEGVGPGIQRRAQRLGVDTPEFADHIVISEWTGSVEALKEKILDEDARWVFIDSVSVVDPRSDHALGFSEWARDHDIGVVYIAHAYKNGKDYKGDSKVGHEVDAVLRAYRDEEGRYRVETEKNRALDAPPDSDLHAPSSIHALTSFPSPDDVARENPGLNCSSTPQSKQCRWWFWHLENRGESESSSDAETTTADEQDTDNDTDSEGTQNSASSDDQAEDTSAEADDDNQAADDAQKKTETGQALADLGARLLDRLQDL